MFNFFPCLSTEAVDGVALLDEKVKAKAEARQEKAAEEAGMVVAKPPGEPASFSSYADSAPRWGVEKSFEKKTRYSQTGIASIPSTPLPVLFRDCCAKNGDKMALSVERGDLSDAAAFPPDKWTSWTFAEYLRDVEYAAAGFVSLGCETFSSVGIWGFNAPEWHISCMAGIFLSCPPSGIYPTDTPDQVQYKLDHSNSSILVLEDAGKLSKVKALVDKLPSLNAIVMYGGKPEISSIKRAKGSDVAVLAWADLIARGQTEMPKVREELANRERGIKPGHCAALIYTSGTTGMPKAVMISHDNLYFQVNAVNETNKSLGNTREQERVLSYLPLSHVAGMLLDIMMPPILGATLPGYCTVYFARANDLKDGTIAHRLTYVKPTCFLGVPRVWEKIAEKLKAKGKETTGLKKTIVTWAKGLALQRAEGMQLSQSPDNSGKPVPIPFMMGVADILLKKIKQALGLEFTKLSITGAAPITVETLEYFGQLGIPVNECYGMSECCAATTWSTPATHQWGSCGCALDGMEVKCFKVDEKDNNKKTECPRAADPKAPTDAEQGEICFRGRHVMNGYLANPKLGAAHVEEIKKKTAESIDTDGWLHSGDMGCIDKFGMVRITGRYKELIIGAGGENIAPVPIEDHIKKLCSALSNVMMVGDKRKFNTCVVTLKAKGATGEKPGTDELDGDAKDVSPGVTTISAAMTDPVWLKYIEDAIKKTNNSPACPSNACKIQKFKILPRDFSVETDELTPTLKLKRSVACKIFHDIIEEMYKE
jgi:long-chain-fatty-acid--CoA ligase ACSBG